MLFRYYICGRRLYQYNEDRLFYLSFFNITSLQPKKEKMFIYSFSWFPCLYVFILFEALVEIKIEIRLYCIDTHDDNCTIIMVR